MSAGIEMMSGRAHALAVIAFAGLSLCGVTFATSAARADDDAIEVPAFSLPPSFLLSEKSRVASGQVRRRTQSERDPVSACPTWKGLSAEQMKPVRRCQVERFYESAYYRLMHQYYPVAVREEQLGGVSTQVFTPVDGIAPQNSSRVLINLHGGAFLFGARWISVLESSPIAAVGRIKVVSVDYREAPEFTFPAASEDVAAVYRKLLETYPPQNIGVFGCSAGGLLAAEAVAWFQSVGLPKPGAVAMLCEGGSYWMEGDSPRFTGRAPEKATDNPYFATTDPDNPLAFPGTSAATLAKFPPSLLVSGTRDFALSSVVHTHSVLVAAGVAADLHVWEGMEHAFFYSPDLPESREVYTVVSDFFARQLGSSARK